ncbi:tyrosine recombinase XerC [Herbaspirillum seropedicae]|uniref:tyrosine recombinase XerC n=1 Tax=Herbaspirillum seropedicae TaxID=964 RepID=UPI000847FF4F|nr:tyrosine recombinase XerC [Herbaspirillum seropedicae]AON56654.1 site-specific integrase/recombinase [Herbaspirillum seropedicae]
MEHNVENATTGLIGQYLSFLRTQRKLSDHTVEHYGRDLQELRSLLAPAGEEHADIDLRKTTQVHIRKCAARLHARGLNARSIARKLSAWRGFFGWLSMQMDLAANPVDGVKAPKKSKPLPKALAADDAIRLVSQPDPVRDPDSTLAACNRAMFELLYSSGLRVSELVGIDVADVREGGYESAGWVDLEEAEVTVTGKGGKKRKVPVGQAARAALADWLPLRARLRKADGGPDSHALFLNERGARISPRVAQLRLKTHGRALEMASDVHPHMLRHSFASHVLQSSGDLRAVQEMLGHASITATQVYTALDFQRLAQVYDQAHPRARKNGGK